jgi:membrane dipeptidase
MKINRREFIAKTGAAVAGASTIGLMSAMQRPLQGKKGPYDYIIVQGHYDIWEFNDRLALDEESQNSPLRDHLLPRLLEGGVDVVVMPAGGEAARHRVESDQLLEGSIRSTDMLLREIEKTNGKASVIRTKKDLPEKPDRNHVRFFLDFEGGDPISIPAEPGFPKDERLALLRTFFRLGVRGLQLTRDGRNQIGDGYLEGKGGKLSRFGVEVVQEMNRLGMMVGVSHVSENTLLHAAEVSTKPIVSTHQNPRHFINTLLQLSDEMIKAVAKTGGVAGVRFHSQSSTPYEKLVEMVAYVGNLVGIEHTGFAWLGHDVGHPKTGYVPGVSKGPFPGGEIEKLTKYEQNSRFIDALGKGKFSDKEISMVMGGNFLRVMREVLPEGEGVAGS